MKSSVEGERVGPRGHLEGPAATAARRRPLDGGAPGPRGRLHSYCAPGGSGRPGRAQLIR